jgi:hypothetical protein
MRYAPGVDAALALCALKDERGAVKSKNENNEVALPSDAEVRAALARILTSPVFLAAPKLTAFLHYVVEATLDGSDTRLKGYTVGIEALGRPDSFDPATDPIVRVEAGRLRAALTRYYAGPGRNDPIAIEMARGSYVPHFRRRVAPRLPTRAAGIARRWFEIARRPRLMLRLTRRYRFAASIVAVAVAIGVVIDIAQDAARQKWELASPDYSTASVEKKATPHDLVLPIGPLLYVEPIKVIGTPGPQTISVESLRRRLVDAFARFDDIKVVADAAALAKRTPDYQLSILVQFYHDQSTSLLFRVLDVANGTVVWSLSFDQLRLANETAPEQARIVRSVATALVPQPMGVIHARERLKLANADPLDPYRCLLESYDYLYSFDRTRHAAVRDCLEKAVGNRPDFASGMIQLARVYLREHQFAIDVRPGHSPALYRALAMANRGLELKPGSARAHSALFELALARGDFAAAMPEGERAVALNPNDMPVRFHYGAMLILLGKVEKGEAIVREVAAESTVPPGRLNFILFVAAYLKGDLDAAADYAKQIAGDPIGAGCLARALVAGKQGDWAAALRERECLRTQQAGWRTNPYALLKKLFPAPPVLDRIVADLRAIAAAAPK